MRQLLFISFLVVAASCKKEPLTIYNAEDSIYFNYRPDRYTFFDSLEVSFAYSPLSLQDTLFAIPLAATGTFSDKDRPVSLMIDPSSTAKEGTHYEMPQGVIRAGKVADTLFIRLKRAAGLTSAKKMLILRLQPNEWFKTEVKHKTALTTARETLELISFTITMSDMLSAGPNWETYSRYFGTFSVKKVRFINELLGMPLTFWLNTQPGPYEFAMATFYAATTSRYLSEQAANGNVIYDEDGTLMQMGAAYR